VVLGRHFELVLLVETAFNLLIKSHLLFGVQFAVFFLSRSSVFSPATAVSLVEGGRVMKKFAVRLLMFGATVAVGGMGATGARAQNPPEIQRASKSELKSQTPPARVIAPLGIGTTFNATLDESLDTRKTRAGDPIAAEIAEDVSYEQCMIFPKGTKVTGHIVRVTSAGRGKAGSAIFVQFDKAVMKDGQEVMLNAGIQALAANAVTASAEADAAKSVANGPHAVPVEDNSGGTPTVSDALIVSPIYDAPRSTLRAPMAPAAVAEGEFGSDGLFTPESKGAFGRPDLKVYTPTSEGSHGTVLLSARKNMHLDSGTHLLLVVQPPPNGDSDPASATPLDLDPQ
jgi:hypothetical protein